MDTRYDEAMERARAGMPIDEVFPELKESEDERIRKRLIEYFNDYYDRFSSKNNVNVHWGGLEVKSVIAYLERQKEQKPLSTKETELNSIAFLEQLGYTCVPPGAEQKPAVEQQGGTFNSYDMAKTFADGQYYVMKHLEKFGLCKPAEWSEEDEDKVDDICKLIEHATIIPRSGDDDTGIPPTRLNDKYKGELKAFVKSLRNLPTKSDTWKPSEAQMDWLESALKLSINKPHIHGIIISLYEQLKLL